MNDTEHVREHSVDTYLWIGESPEVHKLEQGVSVDIPPDSAYHLMTDCTACNYYRIQIFLSPPGGNSVTVVPAFIEES